MSNKNNFDGNDNRMHICSICRRDEEHAGKMLKMPGGMYACVDCLQKMLDSVGGMGPDISGLFPGTPLDGFAIDPAMLQQMGVIRTGEDDPALLEEADPGETDPELPEITPDDPEKTDPGKERPSGGDPKKWVANIGFINLADLQNGLGMNRRQQVKKRGPEEQKEPVIDPEKVLPPHKLKAKLDEYVVGQEHAKKIISVAVYNHYKRVLSGVDKTDDGIEIEKSNILMIGPTGCGKTHMVRTLARILDVPLAITDATSLTEAGYIGDDIESVLSKLLQAADNDVDKAEVGIVFIDEIDKIAKKTSTRGRDVSGESVQQGLLKMLEGSEIEVPVGATSKNAMVPLATIDTRNILFICGGAFPELEDIIKERLTETSSIGFMAELKDRFDKDADILSKVETADLRKFGMIPEFLGRLPIVCPLQALTVDMLVKVFKEPKNAILKQYQKLLKMDEVHLIFEDDALEVLAQRAAEKGAGARGLRSIVEEIMLDIMYEIPKDDSIGTVTITKDYIENNGVPIITLRGSGTLPAPVAQQQA
ncbi:MAG: ATP-dependent Clp protease ATP-binding subunit ClpX [Lachnospiraceae bacterium]|jgi:ATP-dependent Clp protease ATP-binding subunit ClpX